MSDVVQQPEAKSRLWQSDAPLDVEFSDDRGWQMVRCYSEHLLEYRAVREAAGLIDLSHFGAIKIGGKEGSQFLQGLVTNDVKALTGFSGMRCAFLTGHGKVRALARVISLGEEYLVLTDPQTHDKVFKYVFPFSYAGDFKVDDESDQYRMISIQGPRSLLIMKEVCFEPVPSLNEHQAIRTMIAGQNVLVVKASHSGDEGYEIHAAVEGLKDIWDFLIMKGSFHGIRPVGFEALDHLRIEAGIPIYGVDVDESNMMLETGLSDAVSFTKGCYTGQEAVAMATYRGHVSKRLSGLKLEGDVVPLPGAEVFSGEKRIGHITSSVFSDTVGSPIGLGYLKYGFFELRSKLEVSTGGAKAEGEVVQLPFYVSVTS